MNNNNYNTNELNDLINLTTDKLNLLHPYVVEKDIYVTQAIEIVTKVQNEFFELVFQGGTCLAKAHRVIKRMSEDCDFRVRAKATSLSLTKGARRKALREFRHDIIQALRQNNYIINDDEVRVRNEGQFMSIRARYDSQFSHVDGIKPFLAIEFFLGEVRTSTLQKPVTTLIKQTLGDKVNHNEHPVNCVSIIETAAEKWVALTRRVATMTHRKHYRDSSLVRHLYDLYKIEQQGLFSNEFESLLNDIVNNDRQQYKEHNQNYYNDPTAEINRAIDELQQQKIWRDHWQRFIDTMVYDEIKPSYDQVLANICDKTDKAVAALCF